VDSCFYFKNKSIATLMWKKKTKNCHYSHVSESPKKIHSNYRLSLWKKGIVTICNTVIKASVTSLLIFFFFVM